MPCTERELKNSLRGTLRCEEWFGLSGELSRIMVFCVSYGIRRIWEEGLEALFMGELYLELFSEEEIGVGFETLQTVFKDDIAERQRIQDFRPLEMSEEKGKALVSRVDSYITEAINTRGPVTFFNPSDPAEWNLKDKQRFHVVFVMVRPKARPGTTPFTMSLPLDKLRENRRRIQGIDLVPARA